MSKSRINAVLALAAVAMGTLVLTTTMAVAAPITVPNAGFENRVLELVDGKDVYTKPAVDFWRHFETADNGGPLRLWDPGIAGTASPGFGGNAPEGQLVVRVSSRYNDDRPSVSTDFPDGPYVRDFEACTQLLTTTFDPTMTYTLTAMVGRPEGYRYSGYAVQFAVGGIQKNVSNYGGWVKGGTVIAQDYSSLTVPVGGFVTSTVTFHPDPADPALQALAGQQLQIRLCALEDPANHATTSYAAFDVVKLEAVSALYWDLDGATAGAGGAAPAGTWDSATANWNSDYTGGGGGSVAAWSADSVACFSAGTDATGTYTVTVDGTPDIRGLNFQDGTVTLTGGTALRMTWNSMVEVAAGLTATVATPVTDDGAGRQLIKKGDGTLVLSGANTYTGGTSVLAGILRLGANGVLPDTSVVTVSGDAPGVIAKLELDGKSDTIGGLSLGGASPTSGAAVTTGTGTLTLGGDVNYNSTCYPLGATISGKLELGATRTFTVGDSLTAADDLAVSADISGAGLGLIKEGDGKLVLSGNNAAATGGMTINAGTVQFDSTVSINGTARDVAVNSGGAVVFGSSFSAGNIPAALLTRIAPDSTGAIAADNYAATNFDFDAAGLTAASLGAVGNVAYTGTLKPNGTTYRLGGGGGTLTMANTNAITGTGYSLIVGGNVVLSGANNYDSNTTLSAGNLGVGNDSAIGSGTLTFNGGGISSDSATPRTIANAVAFTGDGRLSDAVNNGKLTFTNTVDLGAAARTLTINGDANNVVEFSGIISGADGGITKAGGGVLMLSNNNNYTGGTTLSSGTLIIGNAGALGAGRFTIAGAGTLAAAGTIVITNPVDGNSNFSIGGTGALTLGDMTLNANRTITNNNITSATTFGGISGATRTLTFSGDGDTEVTGIIDTTTGGLTKNGAGTLTLSNAASTYSGVTSIAAGTLIVSTLADGGLPSSIGQSTNAGTSLLLANGTTLKYIGAKDSTNRQFRFNGNLAGLSITLDASGSGPINFTSPTGPSHSSGAQTRTLNLIGSNTGENTLAANIGNNGTGALSIVKDGAGMWVLSGANTYTGETTINGGTLLVNGSLAAGSAVTVNSGGTLGGTGAVAGAVDVFGTLSPGASIESLDTGDLLIGATGTLDNELGRDGLTPVSDSVNVTGAVAMEAGANLKLTLYSGLSTPGLGDIFYMVANDGDDAVTGVFTKLDGADTTLDEGSTFGWNSQSWKITYVADAGISFTGGNDIAIKVVPEPATIGLLALGGLMLLRRRRS